MNNFLSALIIFFTVYMMVAFYSEIKAGAVAIFTDIQSILK